MARGKLRPEDAECLRENFVQLKENIEAIDIVDLLYRDKVISSDDKEKIQKASSKSERNEVLLSAISNAGPGDAFEKFIQSLQIKGYIHLDIVKERCVGLKVNGNKQHQKNTQSLPNDGILEHQMRVYDIAALFVGESGWDKGASFKAFKKYKNINFQANGIVMYDFKGRHIQFVDSPSIDMYIKNTKKLISKVQESVETVSEGFHAVLLGIKYHSNKYTQDFELYLDRLKSLYGPNIVRNYCILVVMLDGVTQTGKINLKEWCSHQDKDLAKLLQECESRAVFIDNKANEESIWCEQMQRLIHEIDNLQFNGRRYTFRHFKEAENGRKRMIIEENKDHITTEILLKCKGVLASSSTTKDYSEENALKMKSLIDEVEQLKQYVLSMDEGTDVFNDAKTFVDSVHDLLTKKADDLMGKKEVFNRENRLLKKIEKFEISKRAEEEQLKLRDEIMRLKEDNSLLKSQMKKYKNQLGKENQRDKKKAGKKEKQSTNVNKTQVKGLSVQKILPGLSPIKAKNDNRKIVLEKEPDYSVDVHLRGKYFNISILWEFLAVIFILFMIIFPVYINYTSYQQNKSSFFTGMEPNKDLAEMLKNSTEIILTNTMFLKKTVDDFNDEQTRHKSTFEEMMRNISETAAQNLLLKANLSKVVTELDNIKNMINDIKENTVQQCFDIIEKYC